MARCTTKALPPHNIPLFCFNCPKTTFLKSLVRPMLCPYLTNIVHKTSGQSQMHINCHNDAVGVLNTQLKCNIHNQDICNEETARTSVMRPLISLGQAKVIHGKSAMASLFGGLGAVLIGGVASFSILVITLTLT